MSRDFGRTLREMDKTLLIAVIAISLFGIVVITSATKSIGMRYPIVQTISFLVGLFTIFVASSVDYDVFSRNAKYIYMVNLFLLVIVLIGGVGKEVGGISWLRFGSYLGLQPSELVKVGFIITLARHLEKVKDSINRFMPFIGVLLHIGLLLLLVLMQPDYGTAMVYIFISICMILVAGLQYRYFVGFFGAFLAFAPIAWFFILKPYQKNRFLVFLNPEFDPSDAGYQVIQSKIAIGSGGFLGQGLMKGTQTQLGLLPAKHTDFIFAVIGEEAGFLGCIIAIGLLIFIIFKCINIARVAKDDFGMFISIGVAAMLLFQTFENVGMCIGVMPVTGIPLPFLSYGGSSMLTNLLAIGLVINVWIRRRIINF